MADWNSPEYSEGSTRDRIARMEETTTGEILISYAGNEIRATLAEDGIYTDHVTGLQSRSLELLASTILYVNKIHDGATGEEIRCTQRGYSLWETETSGFRPSKLPSFCFGSNTRLRAVRIMAEKLIAAMPEGCSPDQWMWENYGPAGRHAGLIEEIKYQIQHGHTRTTVCIPIGMPGATPERTLYWCDDDDLRKAAGKNSAIALLTQGNSVIADQMVLADGIAEWAEIAHKVGARIEIIDMTETMNVFDVYNHLASTGVCEAGISARSIGQADNSTYARLAPQSAKDAVRIVRKWIGQQRAAVKEAVASLPC